MRITIDLDEDVLLAVQERARREKRPAGQVLSELARHALAAQHPDGASGASNRGLQPLPRRGPPVSNALIDRLREDGPE